MLIVLCAAALTTAKNGGENTYDLRFG